MAFFGKRKTRRFLENVTFSRKHGVGEAMAFFWKTQDAAFSEKRDFDELDFLEARRSRCFLENVSLITCTLSNRAEVIGV